MPSKQPAKQDMATANGLPGIFQPTLRTGIYGQTLSHHSSRLVLFKREALGRTRQKQGPVNVHVPPRMLTDDALTMASSGNGIVGHLRIH